MEEIPLQTNKNKSNLIPIIIVLIILLAVAFYGAKRYMKKEDIIMEQILPAMNNNDSTDTNNEITVYKNGVYYAIGNYVSPGGAESIDVEVTLTDDVITSAKVESNAFRPNTIKFQGKFISGFSPLVVGKNIDEVKLDKVSGSSLTPKGFNDAIEKIKTEAKA